MKRLLRTLLLVCILINHMAAPAKAQATTSSYFPMLSFSRPFHYFTRRSHCERGYCASAFIYQNTSGFPVANLVMRGESSEGVRFLKGGLEVTPPDKFNYVDLGYFPKDEVLYFAGWTTENITPTVALSVTNWAVVTNQTNIPVHHVEVAVAQPGIPVFQYQLAPIDTLLPGESYTVGGFWCWNCDITNNFYVHISAQGRP